ncbi:hypothetical protein LEP1GSC072_0251 [Leptospira noguchii str. Bonito]|nr:hypothetical protein LEP1GSC072_0251 [Leptospira noguchii str. Bonito]
MSTRLLLKILYSHSLNSIIEKSVRCKNLHKNLTIESRPKSIAA